MNSIHLKMVLAGIFFSLWPMCMNRSGLQSTEASTIFVIITFLIIVPFFRLSQVPSDVVWMWVIAAGITGAFGLLVFNSGLAAIEPKDFAPMFVIMIMVQILTPAFIHMLINGLPTKEHCIGFVAAGIAVYYLS